MICGRKFPRMNPHAKPTWVGTHSLQIVAETTTPRTNLKHRRPRCTPLKGNEIDFAGLKFWRHLRATAGTFPVIPAAQGAFTARLVRQKLTLAKERGDKEGTHAAGGQQVHPGGSRRSSVGAVSFRGLLEPLS